MINEDKTANLFSNLSSFDNNCSYFCLGQKVKFQTDICIDSCSSSDYKYEYNNVCYEECPKGTNSSLFNLYLCEKNIFDVSTTNILESTGINFETSEQNIKNKELNIESTELNM